MRPGREIDARIAQEVFGYKVWTRAKTLMENTPDGERPLRKYTKDMESAWEVARHMHITLIPIEGSQWFAFAGPEAQLGWASPQALLQFLEAGDFNESGASVQADAALAICEAALHAAAKRRQKAVLHLVPHQEAKEKPPLH